MSKILTESCLIIKYHNGLKMAWADRVSYPKVRQASPEWKLLLLEHVLGSEMFYICDR